MDKVNLIKNNYINVLKSWKNFKGRAARSEYWWFFLANVIIGIVCNILDMILIKVGIPPFIGLLYNLFVLVPSLAVAFRRIHDINKNAWFLCFVFIPIAGPFIILYFFVQPTFDKANTWGEPAKPVK